MVLVGSFITFSIAGISVLLTYVLVLFDAVGWFPLPETMDKSLLKNPYWLGLPSDSVIAILVLWGFGAIGYVIWFLWVFADDQRTVAMRPSLFVFLFSSIAWPFATHHMLTQTTQNIGRTILSCLTLWLAAGGAWWMVAQTFLIRAPAHALLGVLMLANVVVLVDGIGWTIMALSRQ